MSERSESGHDSAVNVHVDNSAEGVVEVPTFWSFHKGCGLLGGGWASRSFFDRKGAERALRAHKETCNATQ